MVAADDLQNLFLFLVPGRQFPHAAHRLDTDTVGAPLNSLEWQRGRAVLWPTPAAALGRFRW